MAMSSSLCAKPLLLSSGLSKLSLNPSFFSSVAVRAGERLGRRIATDAVTTQVVNTCTYFFRRTAELIDSKEKRGLGFEYGRYGNPTTEFAEEKISALEGAESTLLLASGTSAGTLVGVDSWTVVDPVLLDVIDQDNKTALQLFAV